MWSTVVVHSRSSLSNPSLLATHKDFSIGLIRLDQRGKQTLCMMLMREKTTQTCLQHSQPKSALLLGVFFFLQFLFLISFLTTFVGVIDFSICWWDTGPCEIGDEGNDDKQHKQASIWLNESPDCLWHILEPGLGLLTNSEWKGFLKRH